MVFKAAEIQICLGKQIQHKPVTKKNKTDELKGWESGSSTEDVCTWISLDFLSNTVCNLTRDGYIFNQNLKKIKIKIHKS